MHKLKKVNKDSASQDGLIQIHKQDYEEFEKSCNPMYHITRVLLSVNVIVPFLCPLSKEAPYLDIS